MKWPTISGAIPISLSWHDATDDRNTGIAAVHDATNIRIISDYPTILENSANPHAGVPTLANWKAVATPYNFS